MNCLHIGNATLYHGDCFDILPSIACVDAVISDPPYGCTDNQWDAKPLAVERFWHTVKAIAKKDAVFALLANMRFAVELISANHKMFRYDLIWHKNRAVGFLDANKRPLRAHELILIFCRKLPLYHPQKTPGKPYFTKAQGTVSNYSCRTSRIFANNPTGERCPQSVLDFSVDTPNASSFHPTQKPVALMEWLVKTYTNPGDIVLDPFMGSGSTGIACLRNGRRFIGIEREEKYFEVACQRLAAECGQAAPVDVMPARPRRTDAPLLAYFETNAPVAALA